MGLRKVRLTDEDLIQVLSSDPCAITPLTLKVEPKTIQVILSEIVLRLHSVCVGVLRRGECKFVLVKEADHCVVFPVTV